MDDHAKQPHSPIDIPEIRKLTPLALLKLAERLSLGSWLTVVGLLTALIVGSYSLGYGYRDGTLPQLAYSLHGAGPTPREARIHREEEAAFTADYSELVNWRTLEAVASGIAEDNPDGLTSPYEIAASLLAQVRATRGSAAFLAGNEQISVKITRTEDGFGLEWDRKPSLVPRIASDAGYALTDAELRTANSNLNWAQFSYLDDAMQHAVIYRDLDGSFGLVLRDN